MPRCEEIPGYFATVRQDTREVLGIVGERYRIVQNDEAFAFVDQLLGSAIHFETAGSLHGGRRVWVLATLPEHVEVGGDPVRPYVLLMNSHDGSTAVIAATTPIRVVCQNTLNWGLRNARQKFSIRHTEAVTQRVHEARRVLELSIDYYEQFKRYGDELASQRCTERQLRRCPRHALPEWHRRLRRAAAPGARASRPRTASPSCSCTATRRATRPAPSGRPSTRSSSTATGFAQCAHPLSGSPARSMTEPTRRAHCSSSRPREAQGPAGVWARRAYPLETRQLG